MATTVPLTDLIEAIAQGIATEEDFYKKTKNVPAISQRLNNPGCLDHWKNPKGRPYDVVNGFANFPDEETGWKALRAQCLINLKRNLTWREFFAGKRRVYVGFRAHGGGKHPNQYAESVLTFVCRRLRLSDPPTSIDSLIADLLDDPAAIARPAASMPKAA